MWRHGSQNPRRGDVHLGLERNRLASQQSHHCRNLLFFDSLYPLTTQRVRDFVGASLRMAVPHHSAGRETFRSRSGLHPGPRNLEPAWSKPRSRPAQILFLARATGRTASSRSGHGRRPNQLSLLVHLPTERPYRGSDQIPR